MTISDILPSFGAFMAVLITIARKFIVLDYTLISSDYVYEAAALVLAMNVGYCLVVRSVDARLVVQPGSRTRY